MSNAKLWIITLLVAFGAAGAIAQEKGDRASVGALERRVERLERSLERLERAVARLEASRSEGRGMMGGGMMGGSRPNEQWRSPEGQAR